MIKNKSMPAIMPLSCHSSSPSLSGHLHHVSKLPHTLLRTLVPSLARDTHGSGQTRRAQTRPRRPGHARARMSTSLDAPVRRLAQSPPSSPRLLLSHAHAPLHPLAAKHGHPHSQDPSPSSSSKVSAAVLRRQGHRPHALVIPLLRHHTPSARHDVCNRTPTSPCPFTAPNAGAMDDLHGHP
jgi:hypothetical protein